MLYDLIFPIPFSFASLLQPDLDDKEDEVINQEIMQLERGLCQEVILRHYIAS